MSSDNCKYNVLFIAVDDLRPQLSCYGDSTAHSPNIDQLAENGVVFNRAYCQQAVCNPSRASLMTGMRPDTIGVWDLNTHFRQKLPDVVTLPQYFKKKGYHAECIGKIYHGRKGLQDAKSWSVPEKLASTKAREGSYVLEENIHNNIHKRGEHLPKVVATECADVSDDAYIDGWVANEAIESLTKIQNESFFLAVGFRRPHLPFSAPKKYWDLYDREKLNTAENPFRPVNCPEIALHNWKELRGYTDIPPVGDITEKKAFELIHGYYAATSYMDAQVGTVIGKLQELGLKDNTVIILWGDHGWHLGEHNLWGKTTNFELDARAPLIISAPGMKVSGKKENALVEFVDIYPTLCDLCGLEIPKNLEGVSMVPLLKGEKQTLKEAAFSQFPRWPNAPGQQNRDCDYGQVMGYSMRTDRYRYNEWVNQQTDEVVARELYDHQHDPQETVNVVDEPKVQDLASKLSEKLLKNCRMRPL